MDKLIAYKGFDKDLKCRDFQYEVGKEYELPEGEKPEICSKGFHACESPLEVLEYYFLDDNTNMSRFCEVEQSGELLHEKNEGSKVASSKIKIKTEMKFADFIRLGVEWLKEKTSPDKVDEKSEINLNDEMRDFAQIGSGGDSVQIGSSGDRAQTSSSGDFAKIGSSGDRAQIGSSGDYVEISSSGNHAQIGSSGDHAKISSSGYFAKIGSSGDTVQIGSSGDYAKIGSSGDTVQISSSGDCAQIGSSGDFAKISSSGDLAKISSSGNFAKISSSGNFAQINSTGESSVIMCAGCYSKAKAKKGSWITLAEWYEDKESDRMQPKCVKTEYVDGERIKADTWYKLVDGEFVSLDTLED